MCSVYPVKACLKVSMDEAKVSTPFEESMNDFF